MFLYVNDIEYCNKNHCKIKKIVYEDLKINKLLYLKDDETVIV